MNLRVVDFFYAERSLLKSFEILKFQSTVENKDGFPVRVKNTLIIPRNLFLALTSVPRFLTRFLCDLICCPIPCSVRGILFVPKLRPGELDFLQAYFVYPVSLLPMLCYPCHIAFSTSCRIRNVGTIDLPTPFAFEINLIIVSGSMVATLCMSPYSILYNSAVSFPVSLFYCLSGR